MLSRLLALHEKEPSYFTENDVLIGAYTAIAAGADTTWVSLGSVLYYLHRQPETLQKLRAEIDTYHKAGKLSDPITFDEAKQLPYLNAVIKEAQRIHPPTGFPLWRVVPESGATICGRHFRPGVSRNQGIRFRALTYNQITVGVNTWVAHRSSAFDPDPDTFRPERWLEASKDQLLHMNASHIPVFLFPPFLPSFFAS